QKGLVKEEEIARALGKQVGIPYLDLEYYSIDTSVKKVVSQEIARRYNLIPIFKLDNKLTIAVSNPFNIAAIDELEKHASCDIDMVMSTQTAIAKAIGELYTGSESMEKVIENIVPIIADEVSLDNIDKIIGETPLVKLVDIIVTQAVKERASDIHIESNEKILRIRYRIDGVLRETFKAPKHLQAAIISRIKVMAGMNIAEKHISQDGHIQIKKDNKIIDFRVATFPTIYGESIVLRLLYRGGILFGLSELGFEPEMLKIFKDAVKHPHGLILTTGPTGCGKTTTLYAALNTINSLEKKILTIEDPVEYGLDMVNQSQINLKAGITFASGLRAILRQDPDVIMVGEIRDQETARIAIQAALTGHLVFSSLHTNDAIGTITRLIDMGVEPFLVSSTLLCALGQRLIRLLCPRCKESYEPTPEEIEKLNLKSLSGGKELKLYKAKGCKSCAQTGYWGRSGIYELMVADETMKELISAKASSHMIKKAAEAAGMITLRKAGLKKVLAGQTTLLEVMRVTQEV
ncbi:MAG: ATPase, T2SS/T4P/T4SS family, partial [Candidatus Omnitrophota bacterium]